MEDLDAQFVRLKHKLEIKYQRSIIRIAHGKVHGGLQFESSLIVSECGTDVIQPDSIVLDIFCIVTYKIHLHYCIIILYRAVKMDNSLQTKNQIADSSL